MQGAVACVASFLVGAIPFSNLAARMTVGVDLRTVGSGTVSGTSLYRATGFVPLAIAGMLDVAKGALVPALVVSDEPVLAAVAGGLAVAGHNWSPFLRGAGGRGISPALGALLVLAWPGAVLLLLGMLLGRAFRETSVGTFGAIVALVPVTAVTHGRDGALAAAAVVVPMLVKRVLGNQRPEGGGFRAYAHRLLYDSDPVEREAT